MARMAEATYKFLFEADADVKAANFCGYLGGFPASAVGAALGTSHRRVPGVLWCFIAKLQP